SETNASERPSGDHAGDSPVPRAKNAGSAGLEPSSGAIQIRRSCTNATRSPVGAIAGSSPSPRSFGDASPAVAIENTCIRAATGTLVGFGCTLPSAGQLAP